MQGGLVRRSSYVLGAALLVGCTTNPIPDGYTGSTATIRDWVRVESDSKALIFYVSEVDGRRIPHSLSATRVASHGRGQEMRVVVVERKVPAQLSRLKLEGRVAYAAPILELVNSSQMFSISEIIEVDIKPGSLYRV